MLQAPRIVRWTLPALLLTLLIGGYVIVSSSLRADGTQPGSSTPATTTTTKRHHKPKRVKVRKGDTAASIAHRSKLTVVELLRLNPKVDPRLLRPGQRLKITR
ncbi:MAG: LysM domain [bacterium]|jgi:LysM repeat protein